jgi:hypothetical protein
MKKILTLIILSQLLFIRVFAQDAAYLRSNTGEPWWTTENIAAMNDVFGSGNWTSAHFETVNANTLFSSSHKFVFIEGSESGTNAMFTFLQANLSLIENWVAQGNTLYLNSASNQRGGSVGFGVTFHNYIDYYIDYGYNFTVASYSVTVSNPSHPLFSQSFQPVATSYTGFYFAHDLISGSGLSVIITGDGNDIGVTDIVLAEKTWGSGKVMFGGITTPNFHEPNPEASNLRRNTLKYLYNEAGFNTYIATSSISSPLCVGTSLNVSFTAAGTFNAGNTFTAHLSDASGSFSSPTNIGNISSTASGTINATIPANTPAGIGYRIRVVSSDPAVTGSDNGSDITVDNLPTLNVSNPNPICSPATVDLATTITSPVTGLDLTYWDGDPDQVSSQELLSSSVSATGTYWIKAENTSGCASKASVNVTVNSLGALAIGSPVTASNPSGSPITTVALGTASTTYQVTNPETGVSYSLSVSYNSGGSEVFLSSGVVGTSITANWLTDAARVYKVKVVSSIAGCTSKQEEIYVAVYDPTAGFVTGGGWITSPEGAYKPLVSDGVYISDYTSPEGKANFGFVSKYKKGSTTVEGNTEFNFQDGNLKFKSSSHTAATLVVSTCRASYRGEGTIEGSPFSYKFMVSVVDGQINGGGNIDKFRIKITEKASGKLVYDNLIGYDDNYDLNVVPSTVIGGGSIVIHEPMKATSGKKATAAVESVETESSGFYIYPSPFSNRATVTFSLDIAENFVLEVFDMKGALVKRVASGTAEADRLYEYELKGEGLSEGVYVTRLTTNSFVQSIKAVLKR